MSNNQTYKISKGLPWQILDDSVIVLAPQKQTAHELDETGSAVWLGITEGKTIDEISRDLTNEFDVDIETAKYDTLSFIAELESKHLVEIV